MSESTPTPGAAPTPASTPASAPKSTGESAPDAQSEQGTAVALEPTSKPTLELTSVEKALYELGFSYQVFRFWAETCWFEVGESPCDLTKHYYWRVGEILEYLLAQLELDANGTKCLQSMQQAHSLCWNALRDDLTLPERCQLAERIRDSEPEFLTRKLWSQNTVLNRAEWKEHEARLYSLCRAIEQPLSFFIEAGVLVARGQIDGYGPSASRSQHFSITRLHDALLGLHEHYPDLGVDALDVSKSRLDGVATESQISLEQAIGRCCETIHATLVEKLSTFTKKRRRSRARKKKPINRNTAEYKKRYGIARPIVESNPTADFRSIQRRTRKGHPGGIGSDYLNEILKHLREEGIYRGRQRASGGEEL